VDLEQDGSLVILTDGRIYLRNGGTWSLLPIGGQETFRTISAFPATIAADDVVLEITASGTLALPTATAGRKLVIINSATLTLTHSAVEQAGGGFSTSLSLIPGESVTLRGNGTQWRLSPG
jgi:hypothetical protein